MSGESSLPPRGATKGLARGDAGRTETALLAIFGFVAFLGVACALQRLADLAGRQHTPAACAPGDLAGVSVDAPRSAVQSRVDTCDAKTGSPFASDVAARKR